MLVPKKSSCCLTRNIGIVGFLFAYAAICGCDARRSRSGNDNGADESGLVSSTAAINPVAGKSNNNTPELSMVLIPSDEFLMGNRESEQFGQYSRCESPQHTVRITRSFHISRFEVTVEQFRSFVEATRYLTEAEESGLGCNGLNLVDGTVIRKPNCIWSSPGFAQNAKHPVVCVSWQDAVSFCEWLSASTGHLYRLPTEAEWEYCCRAGSEEMFATGHDADSLFAAANCGDRSLQSKCRVLTNVAGWSDGYPFTAPVGSFEPNAFGIYDMHGNTGEWCSDWFAPDYYHNSESSDPRGPELVQQWHVVRGGSWYNNPVSCRSSGRHDGIPTEASTTNGFRVVREIVL